MHQTFCTIKATKLKRMILSMPPTTETITVDSETFFCDGSDGPLGHPRVFLHMTKIGHLDCPYCGRHFIASPELAHAGAGH